MPAAIQRLFRVPALILFCLLLSSAPPLRAELDKTQVISKYEKAVALAEELDVYKQDILDVVPKIRLAGQALLDNDIEKADRIVNDAMQDLELVRRNQPNRYVREWRLEWLGIVNEIVQKYALLALLAFFFVRIPVFSRLLVRGEFTITGSLYAGAYLSAASILFSILDLSRYGASAWSFFDLPLVCTVAGGLLGGWGAGLLLGVVNGGLRFVLGLNFWNHAALMILAGLASGFIGRKTQLVRKFGPLVLVAGLMSGLLHGFLAYGHTLAVLSWFYFSLTILFLILIETGALAVFLGVVSAMLGEKERQRMESDLLSSRLLFLQAQIRPHFIFNALNAVASICSRDNAMNARALVPRLAGFLREAIKRQADTVTLKEEMEYIENYLEIEQARFQDRLKVKTDIQLKSGVLETRIPILALQPLVENAVIHGASQRAAGGEVRIEIRETPGYLDIAVSDNGPGIPEAVRTGLLNGKKQPPASSIGLRNIHERLERLYGKGRGLKIETPPEGGTCVRFSIPASKGTV